MYYIFKSVKQLGDLYRVIASTNIIWIFESCERSRKYYTPNNLLLNDFFAIKSWEYAITLETYMITHVNNAIIWVTDQERAKNFYVETLGFELCTDNVKSGVRYLKVAPRNAKTKIYLMLPEGGWMQNYAATVGSMQALALNVSDIRAVYEELSAKGVTFLGEPQTQPWGNTYAVFEDSEGNHILLIQEPNDKD